MNTLVARKFSSYPDRVRPLLKRVRSLVLDVAKESNITDLEECLKWDQPSYVCKSGSTVRIDWEPSTPENYFVYFHCQSKLVETFREIYPDIFHYSGRRAIVLEVGNEVPEAPLKHCLHLALNYHKLKHLPLLGVTYTFT